MGNNLNLAYADCDSEFMVIELNQTGKSRMVIVGAGFGGLWAARSLAKEPVHAPIVDRNNYHTFLALLYQVAAAELEAEDIAYPVRSILWKFPNVDFALAHARRIDLLNRAIETDGETISYDYLILAAGSISQFLWHTGGGNSCLWPEDLGRSSCPEKPHHLLFRTSRP